MESEKSFLDTLSFKMKIRFCVACEGVYLNVNPATLAPYLWDWLQAALALTENVEPKEFFWTQLMNLFG